MGDPIVEPEYIEAQVASGCLIELVGLGWGAGGQAQVRENLDDHLMVGMSVKGPPHCGQEGMSIANTR
jgi:hypothetical protein